MSRVRRRRPSKLVARSSSISGCLRIIGTDLRQPSGKLQTRRAGSSGPCVPSRIHHSDRACKLLVVKMVPTNANLVIRLAAQPDSQQRRLAAPLPQYGQPTTSTAPGPVPQFGVPLPHRPEAPSSFSNKRELESDYEARKQELYRRKVEQSLVEREAHRKWQEEVQRLKEMSDEFDEFVISGSNSMGKRPRRE